MFYDQIDKRIVSETKQVLINYYEAKFFIEFVKTFHASTFKMIHDLFDLFANIGADPGFLDSGFKFTKGFRFVNFYLILYQFFPNFLKILHENLITLSQRGFRANALNPLLIHH